MRGSAGSVSTSAAATLPEGQAILCGPPPLLFTLLRMAEPWSIFSAPQLPGLQLCVVRSRVCPELHSKL